MVKLEGTYKLTKSDGFDVYMKALGVGLPKRTLANNTKPTLEITRKGDDFVIKTITTLRTYEQKFTLNVPFDETSMDDVQVKSTVTLEGENTLKQVQERPDKKTEIIREFHDDHIDATFKVDAVVSTRVYTRV